MNRDVLEVNGLLIATDISASIGELPLDKLAVPYEVVGYYLARVVLMELMSAGGNPIAYTLGNATTNGFDALHKGIKSLFAELGLVLPSLSSSETNFELSQSSASITLIGEKVKTYEVTNKLALAGKPLVGEEVQSGEVLDLVTFKKLLEDPRVDSVVPVGSKGILFEAESNYSIKVASEEVDVVKSSGPSTCVIVNYNDESVFDDYELVKLETV